MKKSIAKNYIYNLLYQMLTIILPLITTPYLSRVLGAEAIGIYGYTLSIVTYFVFGYSKAKSNAFPIPLLLISTISKLYFFAILSWRYYYQLLYCQIFLL